MNPAVLPSSGPASIEARRSLHAMLAFSVAGFVLAACGVAGYALGHGKPALWVFAAGIVLGVGGQIRFIRDVLRRPRDSEV